MKLPIAFSIVALAIGIVSNGFADPPPVSGAPGGVTSQPSSSGITAPTTGAYSSGTGSTGPSSSATPNYSNSDESDDTLYRGNTSETDNPSMPAEAPLHLTHR